MTKSLEATDARGAENAVAPRVTLDQLKESIKEEQYILVEDHLTICVCKLKNGFFLVGKSAPISKDNFDAQKGREFAYEDCIRQLWPLEAYARLSS